MTQGRGWVGRRAVVPAGVGWIVGTALQLTQPALWTLAGYAALGLAAAAVALSWARRCRQAPDGARCAWGWLPVAAALAFALTGVRALALTAQALPAHADGARVQAVWRVTALPQRGEGGTRFDAELLQATRADGTPLTVAGTVRVSWRVPGTMRDAAAPQVLPGQTWRGVLRLRAPRGLANPYGFDAETWWWREGVVATASVLSGARDAPPVLVTDEPWRAPVERARTRVRDAIVERLAAQHPPAAVGLVAALVTGDQAAIPGADWAAIRATGVAHLVAISGLHVTLFAWLAIAVVQGLWRAVGRRWPGLLLHCPAPVAAGVGGVALAWAYALFAGWGVPAQRTVVMLAAVVALQLSGRRWPWPVIWLGAMAVALLIDPWAWWQPGFWLSFVAVAVLFGLGPAPSAPRAGVGAWLVQAARELLRVQAVVTLALAPLTLWWFGHVSLVGLVANLIAIPWVTWVMTPVALAGLLAPPLWGLAGWMAQGLLELVHALAAWPGAVWSRPAPPWPLALAACAGALLCVWRVPWRWRWGGALLVWPVLAYQPAAPAPGTFEVLLPDVGQGSAAIVRTARHTLLFDAGPPLGHSDAAARVLLPWLQALGERPSAIVVSHDDSDHAAGLRTLARAYPGAQWWTSFDPGARHGGAFSLCTAGVAWEWDGVRFEFLHPPAPDWVPPARGGDNARSCVLRIGQGARAALLTGDIREAEELALLRADPTLRTGLLVAAHHGSRTSTAGPWLDGLRPQAVVIQAGWRNRYGHPHPQVVQRLQARRIPWVNTATCGAVTWRSTAPERLACERERRRRYWMGAPAGAVGAAEEAPADTADAASP